MPGLASHLHEVGHTRGVPDWSWQGVTGAFEKYIGFFSFLPKLGHTQTQRKCHASWKSWRGIFVTSHRLLAPGWLFADEVVFQLVCPKWIREGRQPQKSLHWQHPGPNSPPRQEVAWSILPGLILEGVCLLAQLWEKSFALEKCFYSIFITSPSQLG